MVPGRHRRRCVQDVIDDLIMTAADVGQLAQNKEFSGLLSWEPCSGGNKLLHDEVHNELRKELDITLKALKQAQKIKLTAFRIQKTMFLKRMSLLEKRRLHLKNIQTTRNKTNLLPGLPKRSEALVTDTDKTDLFDSKISQQDNLHSQYNSSTTTSNVQHEKSEQSNGTQLSKNMDQLLVRPREDTKDFNSLSSANSEWMSSIQNNLQKTNFNAVQEDNQLSIQDQPQEQSDREGVQKPASKPKYLPKIPTLTVENKSGTFSGQNVLPKVTKENIEMNNFSRRLENKKSNRCLVEGNDLIINNTKFATNKAYISQTTLATVNGSGDRTGIFEDPSELSVVNDFLALSLDENRTNLPLQHRLPNVDQTQVVSNLRDSDCSVHNNETMFVPAPPTLSVVDYAIKSGMNEANSGSETIHQNSNVNTLKELVQTGRKDGINMAYNKYKHSTSKQANFSKARTGNPLFSSPRTPYLGRSQRHIKDTTGLLGKSQRLIKDKSGLLLKNKISSNPSPLPGNLERNVTMIFVDDPTASHDPPKSQFDFEAWLAYNRRSRGHTEIFDDKSSIDKEDTNTETHTTIENKKEPKNNVRFHFSRRSALQSISKPELLTFRERSKEWYLNFIKSKRNKTSSDANKNLQENREHKTHVTNRWSYTLLPSIGTKLNYDITEDGRSDIILGSNRTITAGNHIRLSDATDKKLQQLKDHSKILQLKVQQFMYS